MNLDNEEFKDANLDEINLEETNRILAESINDALAGQDISETKVHDLISDESFNGTANSDKISHEESVERYSVESPTNEQDELIDSFDDDIILNGEEFVAEVQRRLQELESAEDDTPEKNIAMPKVMKVPSKIPSSKGDFLLAFVVMMMTFAVVGLAFALFCWRYPDRIAEIMR